jgi:hypothetical protein
MKSLIKPKKVGSYQYQNKNFFSRLLIGDWLYFPSTLWNTEIIKREKFNEKLHTAMDLEILLRLISKNYTIFHLSVKMFAYRRHAMSASSLYAQELGRFEEELSCHRYAVKIAKEKKWILGLILARLALTVRVHKLIVLIKKLIFNKTNPSSS